MQPLNLFTNNTNRMTIEEITKKHLTLDKNHIKPCEIDSKDLLYDILKWWRNITKHEKIGDKNIKNGNTPLIRINIGSNKYVINADSKKEGVIIFLKNKNNPWILIQNENGLKNKITNNLTEEPIQGFYMYKL